MDLFDLLEEEETGIRADQIRCPVLVIGVTTDVLFPVWQQRELAEHLTKRGLRVDFLELDAPYGHDTFLIDLERVGGAIRAHLERD